MAIADAPDGPWTRFDTPILDVRPGTWERYLVSNSSPLVMPDGSILLYYKGVEALRTNAIGVARRMGSTERPQILVQDGVATHVFIATGRTVDGVRQTWNQVIPLRPAAAVADRAAWWREARFGMFIHWGLYAIPGGAWNGTPVRHDTYANPYAEHLMWLARVPLADCSPLASRFSPDAWDARAVVAAATRAGMKYIVLTAKHHDGFAMYRSAVSRYNVVDATPWKRDPLAELAAAAREAGLKLGIYYSLGRDWEQAGA